MKYCIGENIIMRVIFNEQNKLMNENAIKKGNRRKVLDIFLNIKIATKTTFSAENG